MEKRRANNSAAKSEEVDISLVESLANELEQIDLTAIRKPPKDLHLRWVNWHDKTNFAIRKMQGYRLVTEEEVKKWDVVCGQKELHDLVLMALPMARKLALEEVLRRKRERHVQSSQDRFHEVGERLGVETFESDDADEGR